MTHHTSSRFAGWAEALDLLHDHRAEATSQPEPESFFTPSDLLPHQVMQIEQIRRMTTRQTPWPARPDQSAIAPLRAFEIDSALQDYCLAELLHMEVMELLALEFQEPDPVPQSYPIANLPRILQPDPDPFRVRPAQALNRRPT